MNIMFQRLTAKVLLLLSIIKVVNLKDILDPCPDLEGNHLNRKLVDISVDGIVHQCCGCPENYYFDQVCSNNLLDSRVCTKCPEGTGINYKAHSKGKDECTPIPGYIKPTQSTQQVTTIRPTTLSLAPPKTKVETISPTVANADEVNLLPWLYVFIAVSFILGILVTLVACYLCKRKKKKTAELQTAEIQQNGPKAAETPLPNIEPTDLVKQVEKILKGLYVNNNNQLHLDKACDMELECFIKRGNSKVSRVTSDSHASSPGPCQSNTSLKTPDGQLVPECSYELTGEQRTGPMPESPHVYPGNPYYEPSRQPLSSNTQPISYNSYADQTNKDYQTTNFDGRHPVSSTSRNPPSVPYPIPGSQSSPRSNTIIQEMHRSPAYSRARNQHTPPQMANQTTPAKPDSNPSTPRLRKVTPSKVTPPRNPFATVNERGDESISSTPEPHDHDPSSIASCSCTPQHQQEHHLDAGTSQHISFGKSSTPLSLHDGGSRFSQPPSRNNTPTPNQSFGGETESRILNSSNNERSFLASREHSRSSTPQPSSAVLGFPKGHPYSRDSPRIDYMDEEGNGDGLDTKPKAVEDYEEAHSSNKQAPIDEDDEISRLINFFDNLHTKNKNILLKMEHASECARGLKICETDINEEICTPNAKVRKAFVKIINYLHNRNGVNFTAAIFIAQLRKMQLALLVNELEKELGLNEKGKELPEKLETKL